MSRAARITVHGPSARRTTIAGRMRQHPPGSDHRILNLWQSEKSMTNSTDNTRRGFLSTAAALTASAAVAIPANAANALGADPILAAIDAHKAARLAFENAFY